MSGLRPLPDAPFNPDPRVPPNDDMWCPHQVGTWILILVLKKLHEARTPLPDGSPVLSVSRFLALGLEFILMGTEGRRGGQKVWAAHGVTKGQSRDTTDGEAPQDPTSMRWWFA